MSPYTFRGMGLLALALAVRVSIFTSIDCPISNRYAPEIQRLQEQFAAEDVRFSLVFANPRETRATIHQHLRLFGYRIDVVQDPQHDLVRRTGATVTPEAVVFDRQDRLVYRGRIDDRYVDIGIDRQSATTHDLRDAIAATLAGRPVAKPNTPAVGCYLADVIR
jgi:hypothetical protein